MSKPTALTLVARNPLVLRFIKSLDGTPGAFYTGPQGHGVFIAYTERHAEIAQKGAVFEYTQHLTINEFCHNRPISMWDNKTSKFLLWHLDWLIDKTNEPTSTRTNNQIELPSWKQ